MIHFKFTDPRMTDEHLGYIPGMLSENDQRPARKQLDAGYTHGGGWSPFKGFTRSKWSLEYPGDPPMKLLAWAPLHDEVIEFYESSWVCIVRPDGSYEIARMD